MARYLYSALASTIQARLNCARDLEYHRSQDTATAEWFDKHEDSIDTLTREHMPSGSGFDSGTKLDLDRSHADKLVFTTAFHHMNGNNGMYDGWTEHTITVTPSFIGGFNMRITGRNRNDIKDYIGDTFHHALNTEVE